MSPTTSPTTILVNGASDLDQVPGLAPLPPQVDVHCVADEAAFVAALPTAEVVFNWRFRDKLLSRHWHQARNLKWLHLATAGVDTALFPQLCQSDVYLTNSQGIYDRAMAEYVLGYMLAEVKLFRASWQSQRAHQWGHQKNAKLANQRAAIYGVGSIGRHIAGVLKSLDVHVLGVGRRARADADFGHIAAADQAHSVASSVDWVIGVMPHTPTTQGYFDQAFFQQMQPHARFINVGRGSAVQEDALAAALNHHQIAAALLDVFQTEPLPPTSPLWDVPNLTISAHMSGEYATSEKDLTALFLHNLTRYQTGQPLHNLVDKQHGFVLSQS